MPGGFSHAAQSLRIVEVLEQGGEGLNLTYEVRQGISTHSKGKHGLPINVPAHERAATLEAQIARVADIIAYVNHDIDDAVRAGVLNPAELPLRRSRCSATSSSARIGAMVSDVVQQSLACDLESLRMSEPVLQALLDLRAFMFAYVYENALATAEFAKATGILGGLWEKVRELRLLWDAIVAIGNWASKIIFSPAVWFGLSLLALCLVLWVVGGIVARRSPAAKSKAVGKADGKQALPAQSAKAQSSNAQSAKSRAAKTTRNAPPIDDEMAEIEALLKSRGIE